MPASLSAIVSNRARLERTFDDGESFYIDYRPAQLTPRQMHLAQSAQAFQNRDWEEMSDAERAEAREASDAITRYLAATLIATNLLDSQQRPIVCTLEGLEDVSYGDQQALLVMIQEDQKLGKANGTGKSPVSFSGTLVSPPMGQEATSPQSLNGTHTKRLPRGGKRK